MEDEAVCLNDELVPELINILRRSFIWLSEAVIQPTADLRDNLELDSMHMVELQAHLESRFEFRFDPMDDGLADAFDTVERLASYVRQQITEA